MLRHHLHCTTRLPDVQARPGALAEPLHADWARATQEGPRIRRHSSADLAYEIAKKQSLRGTTARTTSGTTSCSQPEVTNYPFCLCGLACKIWFTLCWNCAEAVPSRAPTLSYKVCVHLPLCSSDLSSYTLVFCFTVLSFRCLSFVSICLAPLCFAGGLLILMDAGSY